MTQKIHKLQGRGLMNVDEIENVEQAVMSAVIQAITDYLPHIKTIFKEETDLPQDMAEDVTREALETMGVSSISERLYGKVDYKKAMYAFLPKPQPIALMLDAKAEKPNGNRTATIQMSQTSMRVKQVRADEIIDEPGKLPTRIIRNGRELLVVTIIAKYVYEGNERESENLKEIIVACIPSGDLQEKYNPDPENSFWRAGRNAPSLGEDFRVRIHYGDLQDKAAWRVCKIIA